MFKKILKTAKIAYNYSKEISTDKFAYNPSKIYFKSQVNECGYILERNSYAVASKNISFAMLQIVQFPDESAPVITTDYLFELLSDDSKEFIINHEIGHYIYHEEILLDGVDITTERNVNMEMEADSYAAEIVGNEVAIEALSELISIFKSLCAPEEGIVELENRIKYIKSL